MNLKPESNAASNSPGANLTGANATGAEPYATPPADPTGLSEDWTAVALGVLVLMIALGVSWLSIPEGLAWTTARVDAAANVAAPAAEPAAAPAAKSFQWKSILDGRLGKVSQWGADVRASFWDERFASGGSDVAAKKAKAVWPGLLGSCLALVLIGVAIQFLRRRAIVPFLLAFGPLFLLALLAYVMAKQEVVNAYNLEYALWALLLGLLISNTIGTPLWMRPAIQGEQYIKIGLVLYGAEVLMGRLLELGLPGIFVAWVVTPIVLLSTFIFGQRVLRISSRELNIVISADMSVCGVSAAIATAAACKAKKEELSLAIGLSLSFTVLMMVVMPRVVTALDLDPRVGGAWIGGTIDSTGAVAAAGEALGKVGSETAITIKMIQNILIGVVAFAVAAYWTRTNVDDPAPPNSGSLQAGLGNLESGQGIVKAGQGNIEAAHAATLGLGEIWKRFPKFVLGFVAVSVLCSLLFASSLLGSLWVESAMKAVTSPLRGWLFCLAFVCIGLDTNFRQLLPFFRSGKPLLLYLVGQSLNLLLTFLMAYLMFGLLFPAT